MQGKPDKTITEFYDPIIGEQLCVENLIYFFKQTPWYDETSNNAELDQTNTHISQLIYMKGVQYEFYMESHNPVDKCQFYLVREVYRYDPETYDVQALYYIVGQAITQEQANEKQCPIFPVGLMFKMPSLLNVITHHLSESVLYLNKMIDSIHKTMELESQLISHNNDTDPSSDVVTKLPLNDRNADIMFGSYERFFETYLKHFGPKTELQKLPAKP